MWWSWKNWFWTVSTLGRYDGLERTDFEQFLLWDSVVVLKELILNSFYFWKVWWSWKKKTDDGLKEQFLLWKEGMMVLKELILNSFYFGTGMMVLKEQNLNSLYFGKVWWSWINWFWTVSNSGNVVVLKELIFISFYFGKVWWSWKNWIWTVSTLGR